MKLLYIYFIALTTIGCASKKTIEQSNLKTKNCPEGYTCKLTFTKDSTLTLQKDLTNAMYYTKKAEKGTTIVTYTISKIIDNPDLMDAGYTEQLMFTIPSNSTSFTIDNFKTNNVIFNVQCFCKGKAGTYPVTSGNITLEDSTLKAEIPEIVTDQLLKNITVNLQ